MKKRGIFSLVLLLAVFTTLAAQDYTDIGTAYELVISDEALAEAETNSSSSVTTITSEEIKAYNAETTAELVNKAIGTTFSSYGALGAAQNVQIRGASSDKTAVYLDGVPLTSAHQGTYDLSSIPLNMIDHIEIIKSGAGNLARTNAIGGMVNLITKKGTVTEKPYTLSFENGSFLPLSYGSSDVRNWASLTDSQKLDLSYSNNLNGLGVSANLGGIVAQNAYTYDTSTDRALRENAGVKNMHGSVNLDGNVGENIAFKSNNMAFYQNLGVPGSTSWPSADTYQNDFQATTNNDFTFSNLGFDPVESVKAVVSYTFARTFFHDAINGDSTHNKHKAYTQVEQNWDLGENYSLTSGIDGTLDYVDSTKIGKEGRFIPSIYANGSIYLPTGLVSLHPSVNIAYISDTNQVSPNASLGVIYAILDTTSLKATVSYAENVPTFSQMYWPDDWGYHGNPDLKTEKGINGDLGASYTNGPLSYEGSLFGRNIYDAIAGDPNDNYIPYNIAHSVYFGTEQSVEWTINAMFALQSSYQYNKSFDLSNGQTLSDNIEVSSVRKHTAKASVSYTQNIYDVVLSGEYLGKTTYSDAIVLLNLSANAQVTENLKTYIAIDNLLNTSYELYSGYPMPKMKVRLGGSWNF
ncbi:outer membrane cobalamin receptor protein [Sphaerochaeta pleomorpha str. Grapes]|uniref:Outer membrane cobalamin receptor protein n=1 Tax=Sphaerochaeta pleomorpha (strain ATCC BAA-1885 / DSM 22778 / Grapes) TaxID=158190 RepID=G8QUF8_SPHPG|nr:TonB-dependent receptor [Sphaerochaeta pleomorpha]AEV29191.1 outer membrane cobalamin receptor protein [Sphaerochaeta pleomorpha str. Grapes]